MSDELLELADKLRRIQGLAVTPGKFSGAAFDEIWKLAAEALALLEDD
jgi:hypothetical protein